MAMRHIDERSFAADYRAMEVLAPPDGIEVREFIDAPGIGSGTCVHVVGSGGNEWCGRFIGDHGWDGALSGIAHHPDPATLLVFDGGSPFMVEAATGRSLSLDGVRKLITGVLPVPSHNLLLLSSPWEVNAVGTDGLVWISPRLSIEVVELSHVVGDRVYGTVDPDDDVRHEFWVDLRSGEPRGGCVGLAD